MKSDGHVRAYHHRDDTPRCHTHTSFSRVTKKQAISLRRDWSRRAGSKRTRRTWSLPLVVRANYRRRISPLVQRGSFIRTLLADANSCQAERILVPADSVCERHDGEIISNVKSPQANSPAGRRRSLATR